MNAQDTHIETEATTLVVNELEIEGEDVSVIEFERAPLTDISFGF